MAKKNFSSLDSLKSVEKVINEASEAIKDQSRTIVSSSIPDILGGALGAGAGAGIGFAGLYGLGVTGLSAAGLTSGLATAGSLIGGGMVAGVGVLAAPAVILGGVGYALVRNSRENKLKEERQRLYTIALKKHQAIIQELKNSAKINKKRADYLQSLNLLLQKAIKELKEDISE